MTAPTADGSPSGEVTPGPFPAGRARFVEYALPPLSRIGCDLMQARLRKQATVFGLGDDAPVIAHVDRAACVARIDADRMTSLNDALAAGLVGDAAVRLRLMRTFVRAHRRLARMRRAVEAALDLGAVPTAGAMRAFFDATTTYHELGALKFAFPHDLVRARFTALLADAAAAYDALHSPPGASLFARLEDARIRLALARAIEGAGADRYRARLARWAARFDLLRNDDLASAAGQDHDDPADVLDREIAAAVDSFGGAASLRAEIRRRRARGREREREHANALACFRTAIAARRDERLWAIGMLQLLHAMAVHEDRNRVEKMRFLRAWERTCAALDLPATETGLVVMLAALRSPPRTTGARPLASPVALPPLFTRIDEHAGRALVARERARLATAAALETHFRENPGLLPAHLIGARVAHLEELTGNLCDLLVRCTFDTGETVVGKAFLPVVKERPTLAFHPAFAGRGRGIDRRMNLFAERIEAHADTAGQGDPVVRSPHAYGYDEDWRVVWLEDVAGAGVVRGTAAAASSGGLREPLPPGAEVSAATPGLAHALRPVASAGQPAGPPLEYALTALARTDWPAALPALARALAAVHAPGLDPDDARSLHEPLRATYLVAHPARFLAPHLDSARRMRRWRRFIALDAGARRALIHGDLCPKNVVRDRVGMFWLLDFDRANVASPAYDVGVFAAHLLIEGCVQHGDRTKHDDEAAARFVALYMDAAGEDEAFAFRVAVHAALALAYRAGTPDFIGVDGSDLQDRITKRIGVLLDRREPWRALAHTF